MLPLAYLAVPYSDPNPAVREERFQAANSAAARLFQQGRQVYSPISHSHPITLAGKLPEQFSFWAKFDLDMLARCEELLVLRLPGWRDSVGVTAEIAAAREYGIPVKFLDPVQEAAHV